MAIINSGSTLRNNNNNNASLGARVGVWSPRGGNMFKKGAWMPDEDAILSDYVRRHGEGGWNAVHRNSALRRDGKSCRLRWANHLKPNLKKGSMSPAEEEQIIELHSKLGNKWAIIANHIEGRTDNDIKNYWYTRLKKCKREGLPIYPPPKIQQPSFSVLKSFDFISPNSPYHSVIPPINLVKDNIDGSLFYFFDPFKNQPFFTSQSQSQSQTQSLSNEIPYLNPSEESAYSEKAFVDYKGKGKVAEDVPREELRAINFKPISEAGCSNVATNGHLEDPSSNLSSLIRMTSEDVMYDQEMAALENINLTSLLEFPVPSSFLSVVCLPIQLGYWPMNFVSRTWSVERVFCFIGWTFWFGVIS